MIIETRVAKPSRLSWITAFLHSSQFCDYFSMRTRWSASACVRATVTAAVGAVLYGLSPPQEWGRELLSPHSTLQRARSPWQPEPDSPPANQDWGEGHGDTSTQLHKKYNTQFTAQPLYLWTKKKHHQPGRGTLQLNSLLNPEMNGEPERGCTDRPWAQFLPQPPTRLRVHLSPSLHLPF